MKGGISPCDGPNVPEDLQSRIAELFAAGRDSLDISRICKLRERAVCHVLAAQQDARYALRQQEALHSAADPSHIFGGQAHA